MIHKPGHLVYSYYEIVDLVGQGGMGAVYQARDLRDMGMVALKQMREDTSAGLGFAKMREKFEQEWQILKDLNHKRIPRMLNAFHEDDSMYYVMEFVEGKSLAAKVRELKSQGKRFPEILLLEYTMQILEILEYLHGSKPPLLHRDIKPENVIVRSCDGEIMLVDFGLARGFSASCGQNTQTQVGTLGFAPLEQVKGKPEIRSDIYGVGATMWFMLTGEVPSPFEIQPIEEMRNDLFPGISEIVNRACNKQISRRFASAERMELAVRQTLAHLQGVPLDVRGEQLFVDEAPMNVVEVPRGAMPASLFLAQALGGVVVVLGGIFFLATLRDHLQKPAGQPLATPVAIPSVLVYPDRQPSPSAPTGFDGPADPARDYRLIKDRKPLVPTVVTPEVARAYQGWLGDGWEVVGAGGSIPTNAIFNVEAGKAAFMLFHHPRGIKLSSIHCVLSRQGGPASFHCLLACSGRQHGLAFLSTFQDGHYINMMFGAGEPVSMELPRMPFEQSMSFNIQIGPNSAILQVDGGSQAEIPLHIGPITDAQIIIPAATRPQRIVVSSLRLSGK